MPSPMLNGTSTPPPASSLSTAGLYCIWSVVWLGLILFYSHYCFSMGCEHGWKEFRSGDLEILKLELLRPRVPTHPDVGAFLHFVYDRKNLCWRAYCRTWRLVTNSGRKLLGMHFLGCSKGENWGRWGRIAPEISPRHEHECKQYCESNNNGEDRHLSICFEKSVFWAW